jgi:hypothetical protein
MFIALSFDNKYVETNARQAFLQKLCQNEWSGLKARRDYSSGVLPN